jgi:outer membrane protein OmpA-like peptidoglycan-associated protein
MKLKPLILSLFFTTYSLLLFSQNTFNWNDTIFVKGAKRIIRIEYDLDAGGMTKSALDTLNFVVHLMKENPFLKIEFDCHTDPQGSDKHSMMLSQARAQDCVDYLKRQGIDSARLMAKGWGWHRTLPGRSAADIAKMKTNEEKQAAYQADRRMEVTIIGPDSANIFKWSDDKFMIYSLRRLPIRYGFDSADIKTDSVEKKEINTLVNFLKFHSYLKVGIYVHTDPQGSNKHDYILSQARAQTITDTLVKMGIDPTRIATKGWEGRKPIYSQQYIADFIKKHKGCDWCPAIPNNRRTEIVILGMKR